MVLCPQCSAPSGDAHRFCFACGAELRRASEPPKEDPLVGRTLPGGYRVTHLVGVGGMGRVYCAEQVALGRTVAVKVVHPHLADDELAAARFLNEARTASRLSHPNSVAIFDFGRTEEAQPYIVMEYLRGRDLGRVAEDEGPLPFPRIVDILRQTLGALEEAHALGIVHRDLKPDNMVLEPLRSGLDFVKVVDFGLAKILEETSPSAHSPALTRPGLVCGTPEYMSPEQGRGDALDGRSDLYSLGVVLFELLTGRVPFVADSATKTLLLHLNEPPPDPRNVNPERAIPAPFAEITLRALAKSREDRWQSAGAFAAALGEALFSVEGRISQPAPATATRCRACGALSPLGQKYCGDCGVSINGSTAPGRPSSPSPQPATRPDPQADGVAVTVQRAEAVGSGAHALPLLARADALEWLEARRHEAEAMPSAAHVLGEAGGGKTRLVGEFLARCTSRGDLVVAIGPDAAWAKVADAALGDAVRRLVGSADGAVDARAWAGARPEAQLGLSLLFGPPRDRDFPAPDERRIALAEALRWALERAGARAGGGLVVLAVDDLDFVDGTSANAFADVLAEPPVVGALFIVTHAPGAFPAREPLAGETWTLSPLPASTFAHLLPARLRPDARPLAPLHVEHLIAWSRESREPPPERMADLVARRAERVAPDARHTLHALAVWGDDASLDVLPHLLPPATDLPAALRVLDRARLVVQTGRTVQIAHPLVRRIVFSSIPAGRKRELFARADTLRSEAPLEIRAKQAMHGGSALEALALLDMLSIRRAAQGDTLGAVSSLRHALDVARRELHGDDLDDPMAAMLVFARKLAEALAACEQWNDAEGVLREALGSAPPASEHRARLLAVLAHVAHARSHPNDAKRYLDEAMRVARQSEHRDLLPMLERLERTIAVA
ncbi:MAG TPA: protein kinase [Polyangiaceae bacterium]|jgi:serine/threonine-protein kinase